MNETWKTVQSGMFDFEDFYRRMAYELPNGGKECRVLEVGVAEGQSLLFLAAMLEGTGASVYAADNWTFMDNQKQIVLDNIARSGLPIEVFTGESLELSGKFIDGYFDFVFLDTSHRYEDTKAEIPAWLRTVRPGGILAGHDVACPTVRQALDEAVRGGMKINMEATTRGWGVWWIRKEG